MANYPVILRILGFQIAPHLVGNKHHPLATEIIAPPNDSYVVDGLEIWQTHPLRLVVEIPLFTKVLYIPGGWPSDF